MDKSDLLVIVSNVGLSILSSAITYKLLIAGKNAFLRVGLSGIDMCKKDKTKKIPEGAGVLAATVFLIATFIFIPIAFYASTLKQNGNLRRDLVQYLSGLLAICSMTLLGFCDDVFNLRWRDKVFLPALASLPLLLVYFVNHNNSTEMSMPRFFCDLVGLADTTVDLGIFYYLYMGSLAIFCTNSINILAGINGVEVGQSLVIACSVLVFNAIELRGQMFKSHLFSAYLIIPYIFVSIPILKLNWYPAEMFVGDTFCYFSGMLFAVVGILGHFGKTMLLFFMPQIFNFAISIPQLTRLVPCPRHRLPRYDSSTDLLNYSSFKIKRNDRLISVAIVLLFEKLGLASVQRAEDEIIISNFTILNYLVHKHGPMTERNLSMLLVKIQMISSAVALALRFTIFDCA